MKWALFLPAFILAIYCIHEANTDIFNILALATSFLAFAFFAGLLVIKLFGLLD